ncbi:MAG: DUF488 domain-containing protein [Bryobacteraceae bacterium]|jgi:uncharacterized protein (DUF488 family)
MMDVPKKIVFTIGHSTRTLEELISVLQCYRVERLVDIRHFPASTHNPQFNKTALEMACARANIEYCWLERLGGFRQGGYLAYTATPDFHSGLEELESLAAAKPTAYMCAEVKWFQCHRRYISDALEARGWRVLHIIDAKHADPHRRKPNRIKCDRSSL